MGCICSHSQHAADDNDQKENNRRINAELAKAKQEYRSTHRLLLLGIFAPKIMIFIKIVYSM